MLKFFATSFDKSKAISGNVNDKILNTLADSCGNLFQRAKNPKDSNVIFIVHTYRKEFVFDKGLAKVIAKLNRPIVMFDFVEAGTRAFPSIFVGIRGLARYSNKNYKDLFDFMGSQIKNVKLYFKRELLLNEDLTKLPFITKSIEYVAKLPAYPKDNKEKFSQRIIDIYMIWGFSNPSRLLLHAELMRYVARPYGTLICDFSYILKDNRPRKMVLIYVPWFQRIPLKKLLDYQNQAKISISMNGCGQKCFRHSESCINSVMAMQDTNLVWTYPWIDGENCIILPVTGKERKIDEVGAVQKLMKILREPELLYSIYLKGMKNANNYQVSNYVSKYIAKEIKGAF